MGNRKFQIHQEVRPTKLAPSYLQAKESASETLTVMGYNTKSGKYLIKCSDNTEMHVLSGAITAMPIHVTSAKEELDNHPDITEHEFNTAKDVVVMNSELDHFLSMQTEKAKVIEASIIDPLTQIKDLNISIAIARSIKKVPNTKVLTLMNFMITNNPAIGHKPVEDIYAIAEQGINQLNNI